MKQQKRFWLAMILTKTMFAEGSVLLSQYQQETMASDDPVDDDRTLLDVFGEVAKEYLTQQVVCITTRENNGTLCCVHLTYILLIETDSRDGRWVSLGLETWSLRTLLFLSFQTAMG